jgi:hypothetical protein
LLLLTKEKLKTVLLTLLFFFHSLPPLFIVFAMGNRVSTSTSPFSLEDLEAIARGPPLTTTASSSSYFLANGDGGTSPSPFDAVAADLAAAVTTLGNTATTSNNNISGAGARKSGGTPYVGDTSSVISSGCSTVHLRKESLKAEIEQQFADVDTSLHAFRCVPDLSRARRLPLLCAATAAASNTRGASGKSSGRRGSRHSDPLGGASDIGLDNDGSSSGGSNNNTTHKSGGTTSSGRAAKRRANSTQTGVSPTGVSNKGSAADTAAAAPTATSPRSWIFRDVAVQPVDLSQGVEVDSTEVYVVVLVQRTSAMGGGTTPSTVSPLTIHNTFPNLMPLPPPTATNPGSGVGGSAATRGGNTTTARSTAAPAVASVGGGGGGGNGTVAEWPRDMVLAFTPRGLATPFSSDINRPAPGAFLPNSSAVWASPSATPRTNGSTSNRPTPRSGGTAAPGSPRSASSLPTPRATGFHYSIHLLTGKQADALTAAAGFLAARTVEKLFLDCPDFDRRLFYHVNTPKAEETIRAYNLYVTAPGKAMGRRGGGSSSGGGGEGGGMHARGSSKASTSTEAGTTVATAAGLSSSSGPTGAMSMSNGAAANASSAKGACGGGIQRGPGSGSISGGSNSGGLSASVGQSSAGASQFSSSNNPVSPASGVSKGSSLYYITATQEATKELLRELLAVMRPVPVVPPRFGRLTSANAAATTTAASASAGTATGISSNTNFTGDVVTVVSSNPAELYSLNALFRVLNGVRVGTPRRSHGSDMTSPLNSARFMVSGTSAGGGNASGTGTPNLTIGMSNWHHDPLPPFRPPRRGPSASATDSHAATSSGGCAHAGDFRLLGSTSNWLQGPQPLDVHAAARAAATTPTTTLPPPPLSSPTSTTPRGTNRMPMARPWSAGAELNAKSTTVIAATGGGHPFFTSAATPPQLPSLALGNLSSKARRPTPLNAPPHVLQTATPSLVTTPQQLAGQPRFALPLAALLPKAASTITTTTTTATAARSRSAVVGRVDGKSLQEAAAVQPAAAAGRQFSPSASTGVRGGSGPSEQQQQEKEEVEAPAKHARPRSRHPSSKKADPKSGGSPTKEWKVQEAPAAAAAAGVSDTAHDGAELDDDDDDYNEVSTQQERAQRLKAAQPEVTEVLPYLFVGGETAARDRAQLLAKGITHIVNTVNWCLDSFYPDAFRYLTLSLSDAADEPIFSLFAVVNGFIEAARRTNNGSGRVFIHCQQGVSRSCTFVIAYVMWKQGLCYDRAYELVRSRRNVCSPNTGFLMNLRLWEAHLATPQLNNIYAYAPYSAESPTPFVYQLVSYFACHTVSIESTEEISQDERADYYQLCADVLRRAVDHCSDAAVNCLTLDPRMSYIFLCAPRRTSANKHTANGTTGESAATAAAEELETQVEACFLVGPACTQTAYVEQAFKAYYDFLRYSFYHGSAHSSTDNAGRVIHFAPLRAVRIIPPYGATPTIMSAAPAYHSSLAASAAEAQALFARHVTGRCSITYAAQPQWETLLSLPDLQTRLAAYAREEESADGEEVMRRARREAELAKLAFSGSDATEFSSPAAATPLNVTGLSGGPQPPTTALSAASSASQFFRSSRHTPRTLRQPQTISSSSVVVQCSSEAERATLTPLSPPPPQMVQHHANPRAHSPSLNMKKKNTGNNSSGGVGAAPSDRGLAVPTTNATAAVVEASEAVAAPPDRSLLDALSSHLSTSRKDAAATEVGVDDSVAASQLSPVIAPPLVADATDDSTCLAAPLHATKTTPFVLSEGDNFAYAYPFTAATRTFVADLDDLEPDQCYMVGFQQPNGISVYLWRGAESPLEVPEVVRTFAENLLEGANDVTECEAVQRSLERREWAACSLHLPHAAADDDTVVIVPSVRVVFVEQGEEPGEFVTLL